MEFRSQCEHFHEHARLARSHSTSYAQEGIKILVYLNGGAIAGMPIATQFFDSVKIPVSALVFGGCLFAIGLVAAALLCLFAFFSEDSTALAYHNYAVEDNVEGDRHIKCSKLFRCAAILCAVGSLVVFIFGCGTMFLLAQGKLTVEWKIYDSSFPPIPSR